MIRNRQGDIVHLCDNKMISPDMYYRLTQVGGDKPDPDHLFFEFQGFTIHIVNYSRKVQYQFVQDLEEIFSNESLLLQFTIGMNLVTRNKIQKLLEKLQSESVKQQGGSAAEQTDSETPVSRAIGILNGVGSAILDVGTAVVQSETTAEVLTSVIGRIERIGRASTTVGQAAWEQALIAAPIIQNAATSAANETGILISYGAYYARDQVVRLTPPIQEGVRSAAQITGSTMKASVHYIYDAIRSKRAEQTDNEKCAELKEDDISVAKRVAKRVPSDVVLGTMEISDINTHIDRLNSINLFLTTRLKFLSNSDDNLEKITQILRALKVNDKLILDLEKQVNKHGQ